MNILILSQSLAQYELDQIVASFPNGTDFVMLTGSKLEHKCVHIVRTASHDSRSLKSRLFCWAKYRRDVKSWIKTNKLQFDLIYGISNPPINSMIGCYLKKKLNAPFVYMNWDIYPQIVEETYSNTLIKIICGFWHRINSRNYPQIDQMITIGKVMSESINKPLKNKINIEIIPIACNVDKMIPREKETNPFIQEKGLEGKFIILYSGKLGYGHNIRIILGAAKKLENYEDIVFVFVGKGPRCEEVSAYIENGGANVRLYPYQPEEIIPYSIASGDIGVVSQEAKLAHLFLPSKTYNLMACGIPVIGLCSDHDDLQYLLETTKVGIPLIENNADKMAESILSLYQNKDKRKQMSVKAREVACREYSEKVVLEKYRALFERVISGENDQ